MGEGPFFILYSCLQEYGFPCYTVTQMHAGVHVAQPWFLLTIVYVCNLCMSAVLSVNQACAKINNHDPCLREGWSMCGILLFHCSSFKWVTGVFLVHVSIYLSIPLTNVLISCFGGWHIELICQKCQPYCLVGSWIIYLPMMSSFLWIDGFRKSEIGLYPFTKMRVPVHVHAMCISSALCSVPLLFPCHLNVSAILMQHLLQDTKKGPLLHVEGQSACESPLPPPFLSLPLPPPLCKSWLST